MRILTALALLACAATGLAYDWEYVGMDGVPTTCVEFDWSHDRVFVGTQEGFWIYDEAAAAWTEFDEEGWIGRQVHAVAWDPGDPQRIVTGRENAFFKGYLELSLDGGETGDLVHVSEGGAFVDVERGWNHLFACGISDITPGELLRSADGGLTWTPLSGHGHTAMTAVAAGVEGEVMVAGDDQVWVSADAGDTWLDIGDELGDGLVHFLISYLPSGDVIHSPYLAGGDMGVWRGDYVAGQFLAWEQLLASEPCREATVMSAPAPWPINLINRFVAITADGRVLVSSEWGHDWVDETASLPSPAVDAAFSTESGHLYVGTASAGVYRYQPVISGIDGPPSAVAPSLAVWPNPFNPQAMLAFETPTSGAVRLEVYDLQGRRVRTLVARDLPSGRHATRWNGEDGEGRSVPAGVYLARLVASGRVQTARLTLVR